VTSIRICCRRMFLNGARLGAGAKVLIVVPLAW
jgi:hypothetical protein